MMTLFYFVGSEENDTGQENPGTFTCKATQKCSGTPQSLRVVKVIVITERVTESLSFKFRKSSFFSKFFKNFGMNVSFYCFSREYSPLDWLESIFYPGCHVSESLASLGCVNPPCNGNPVSGCLGLLSLLHRISHLHL